MSHTSTLPSSRRVTHNSDFSGPIEFSDPPELRDLLAVVYAAIVARAQELVEGDELPEAIIDLQLADSLRDWGERAGIEPMSGNNSR